MDKKLKKNIIYNALYQVFTVILPIFTMPYLTRTLSEEQIGINSYSLSIVQIFILISFFGINNYASREIASENDKNKRNEEFWSIWIIQILFSILSFIALNLFNIYFIKENNMIFFIQSFLVLINMMEISWFFIGIEELKKIVIRNTVIKILMTTSIFVFIKNKEDFYLYILINIITSLVGNIVLVKYLKTYITIARINKQRVIYHLSKSWKFLIPQFSALIYTSLDKVLLGSFAGMTEVAYYDQSRRITGIMVALISSVGVALLPKTTNLVKENNKKEFENLLTQVFNNVFFISIYIVLGIISVSPNFVNWFFSKEYSGIIILMQIVSPIVIFIPIATILWNTILIPNKLDNIAIKSSVYCALISIILNILLDKNLGALGAIISLLIVEFYGMSYRIYYSRKYYNFKTFIPMISKYMSAAILGYTFTIPLNNVMQSNIISTLIIGIVFSIVYFLTLVILKDTLVLNYIKRINIRLIKRNIYDKEII